MQSRRDWITAGGLQIDPELYEFVTAQVLPGLDLGEDAVWTGLA